MALNFPDSPTDGQVFNNYYWDATATVWRNLSDLNTYANFSNTPTGTYTDGFDYKYISFTASGTLNVTRSGFADLLLVGGGGGGGAYNGTGGGAGGVLYIENAYIPAGNHDVVVGDGGETITAAYTNQGISGQNGLPSSLWKYYVPGGGGGGGYEFVYNSSNYGSGHGENGASGGGATSGPGTVQSPGKGVAGIGNDGGQANGNNRSGGGGGAGGAGENATSTTGGAGGIGKIVNIIPSAAATSLSIGEVSGSNIYWGGGGGAADSRPGGLGGGGASDTSGTANTGGGGGGKGSAPSAGSVATTAGGSGIVIVRVRT